MKSYLDSSVLVALYVPEEFSGRVRSEVRVAGQIPFTPLHELEVRNALRVAHGRRRLEADELARCLEHLADDLEGARLAQTQVDLFRVFDRAQELSQMHAVKILARSLDLLHVAAALELRCKRFVSGDDRQLMLAKAAALEPV
ncbi:MAG: type II toxin-antitoxin system VapC family toxin, partial [Candidatus Binatia bacterium]